MKPRQEFPSPIFTYIGIDVSKNTLDCHNRGRHESIDNERKAIRQKCKAIAKIGKDGSCPPPLIVLEATGSYERLLTRELDRAGIPHRRCNPRQVREFARSIGQLAKNDKIDAGIIAGHASATRLQPRPSAPESSAVLRSLVDVRSALVEDRKRWVNRQKQDLGKAMDKEAKLQVAHLNRRIVKIEKQIAGHLASDELLAKRGRILEEICGIGPGTASALLAHLPELGSLNAKSVANLSGLAPHACDSGEMRGQRVCWGGRREVRQALYLPILTAIRYNPEIRDAYRAMLGRGKPKKVAIVAMMRKLLVHLNSLLKVAQHECYAGMAE